ncbi:unnamed protein product [Camellia sinensis]
MGLEGLLLSTHAYIFYKRIVFLLNECDDHPALQKIVDVIEMILAIPLRTPLAEVELDPIFILVSLWQKLEFESWPALLDDVQIQFEINARKQWYTYLNSDFKKGGWSPEEDLLLCEVVSGRTDNAVKNRFSTLCKKRAKHEALAKDNNTSYINPNNKRVIFPNGSSTAGISENATPLKKLRRTHISDLTENCPRGERFLEECATTRK